MMQAVITKEIAIKAVLHGSCFVPKVGQPVSALTTGDLIWAEGVGFTQEDIKARMPLWTLSGYGSGYGYGDGYGDGYGSGYGYGDGYGDGYGKDLGKLINSINAH